MTKSPSREPKGDFRGDLGDPKEMRESPRGSSSTSLEIPGELN